MPSFFKNIKRFFAPNEEQTQSVKPAERAQPKRSVKESSKRQKPVSHPHAEVIAPQQHNINMRHIDNNAIKIVQELVNNKHEAYLVGGCVRDLLLNKRPKDFDVTTSAHPEQAHKLFKRSRLIGRRFKLLHVRFGRDLIEVATFRASHDSKATENQAKQSDSGMILRDNVYGSVEEDALRRDFTINAMYFDVENQCIYDFANGYQDIAARQIKMIGEPEARYREDPVRMLRAVRFAAKLDFEIAPATAAPIKELAPLMFDISPARLFDEVLKLLQSGHGVKALPLLQEYQLLETLLPQTADILQSGDQRACELLQQALSNTDRRIKQKKSVSPAFLFAVMLWPNVQKELAGMTKRMPPMTALAEAASKVLANQVKRTSIPKRFSAGIREIWELQLRLTRRPGNKAEQLLEHPRFRAAYDLLLLREKSGEDLDNISAWWTSYQAANSLEKENLIAELNAKQPKPKANKPPRSRKSSNSDIQKFDVVEQVKAPSAQAQVSESSSAPDTSAAPEKQPSEPKPIDDTNTRAERSAVISDAPVAEPVVQPAPAKRTQEAPAEHRRPRRPRAKNDPRNNR
ncbi:MAG: polynucleotide adenylyltransferase PcnB [Pseudomonadales bacterium]